MEYEGIFFGWAETGTEGTEYCLQEYKHIIAEDNWSYAGLQLINPGDYLAIRDEHGKKMFEGLVEGTWEVDEDKPLLYEPGGFFAGWLRRVNADPSYGILNPDFGQLCINGMWVHWLPTNIDLRLWWDIFFENSGKYVGKLIRKES